MKATGIVRRIDELGRVVIPKEIRRTQRIRRGDPLEIFTTGDGEVIFKKYSPIGEMSTVAAQYTEVLNKSFALTAFVADRDHILAVSGAGRRELADRRIFPAIDPVASGTRNEDLLVDEQMRPFVFGLRRILAGMNNTERAAASFIKGLKGTNTNQEFLVRSAKKHSDYEQTF